MTRNNKRMPFGLCIVDLINPFIYIFNPKLAFRQKKIEFCRLRKGFAISRVIGMIRIIFLMQSFWHICTNYYCLVKNFIVILALFMFSKPVLPVLEYVVLYDYIKNELCENKEKPKLKCNGKCHLAKEMANASDSPEKGNDKKQISVDTSIVFYQEIQQSFVYQVLFFPTKSKISSEYNLSYSLLAADAVFRPPVV